MPLLQGFRCFCLRAPCSSAERGLFITDSLGGHAACLSVSLSAAAQLFHSSRPCLHEPGCCGLLFTRLFPSTGEGGEIYLSMARQYVVQKLKTRDKNTCYLMVPVHRPLSGFQRKWCSSEMEQLISSAVLSVQGQFIQTVHRPVWGKTM